ncbi:LysR family transcriptional regulator [Aquincola sp. MAHUQ-54]|uniref:LysR family transcriptional regulator n=1 Tax=Aquincola agrisoli TaxID=3119538 RepID=A0AAW9QAR9_9BURK
MKLVFLATLDAILRRGSFAAAAEEVGLTPSAVSLQVKRLEEHFGQPLFDRTGRVVQPTAIARELSSTMQESLAKMDALRTRSQPQAAGRVTIGTIRTVQTSTLPVALADVRRRHPQLSVRAVQGDSGVLLEQLKAGEIDAAVVIRPAGGGSKRLHWQLLAREAFVLIAPPDSTGATLSELLAAHDWIQFDTTLTGGRMAAGYLHRLAPRARSTIEIDSIDTIVAMVSAGQGLSVVPKPRHPISVAHPVREIALGAQAPSRQIAFVSRGPDADNRRIRALREACEVAYNDPVHGVFHASP